LVYWRWFDNTGYGTGTNPFEDVMIVEVTEDDGFSWVQVETIGPNGIDAQGGWYKRSFRVQDFVTPSDQFRVRFIAPDGGGPSHTEAAIDGVRLLTLGCEPAPCPLDCGDGDGTVDTIDFLALLAEWGQIATPCDT
ncbi:MAG: hypothetical protein GTO30_08150, partial [Acidobacteria bacterium]|nr:hypothetical protein [Acidobacteriota bacterium]NIQ83719.1 hypothetical protein [Acidobacteriota bacterium]